MSLHETSLAYLLGTLHLSVAIELVLALQKLDERQQELLMPERTSVGKHHPDYAGAAS